MLGAIIGDIIESLYEFYPNNIKTTNFTLINKYSKFTDDTILTCAVTEAVMALMPKRSDKVL